MDTNNFRIHIITEIDNRIIDFFFLNSITDFIALSSVSKYYYDLVTQNQLFNEFKNFTLEMNKLDNKKKDFYNACEYGYLLVAQYFFNKYTINIRKDDEYIFKSVCCRGHIKIIKWLYQLSN